MLIRSFASFATAPKLVVVEFVFNLICLPTCEGDPRTEYDKYVRRDDGLGTSDNAGSTDHPKRLQKKEKRGSFGLFQNLVEKGSGSPMNAISSGLSLSSLPDDNFLKAFSSHKIGSQLSNFDLHKKATVSGRNDDFLQSLTMNKQHAEFTLSDFVGKKKATQHHSVDNTNQIGRAHV